jgi:hypothetical protein
VPEINQKAQRQSLSGAVVTSFRIHNVMIAVPAIFRHFSTYRALSRREQKVLLASLVLLPIFRLGLRLAGLQRFQAWLDRFPVAGRPSLSKVEAAAVGLAVNRAANHVLGTGSCLTRSLLLRWLLRFYGTPSDLRVGVRVNQGKFAAHAWVEMDGIPVNDQPEAVADFVAFDQPVSPDLFT